MSKKSIQSSHRPKRRKLPVHGVLILDKPKGLSSNQAMSRVRWLAEAAKAGHTGALDPMATGVLPICFGEATKFSQRMLDADKSYDATIRLGATTDTYDAEGELLSYHNPSELCDSQIKSELLTMQGAQSQVPPVYSALKHNGKPLYHYMRGTKKRQSLEEQSQNIPKLSPAEIEGLLEKKRRDVFIHQCDLLRLVHVRDSGHKTYIDLDVRIRCSKGTYIRSIAHDLGARLGVGGHLTALRRTRAAGFSIEQSIALEKVERVSESDSSRIKDLLMPVDCLLRDLPFVELSLAQSKLFTQGGVNVIEGLQSEGGEPFDQSELQLQEVRVYAIKPKIDAASADTAGTLIGLGEVRRIRVGSDNYSLELHPKRIVLS